MKLSRLHCMQPARCHSIGQALRLAVVALLVIISVNEYAHSSSFNFRIQDYKPDYFRDMQWSFRMDMNSNTGHQTDVVTHDSGWTLDSRLSQDESNSKQNSLLLQSYLTRRRFSLLSTHEIVSNLYMNYSRQTTDGDNACDTCRSFGYSYSNWSRSHYEYESESFQIQMEHSSDHRRYLRPQFSIGVSASASGILYVRWGEDNVRGNQEMSYADGYYRQSTWSSKRTSWYRSGRLYGSIKIGPAYGRQHEGRYAAAALFALEELKSRGLLDSVPSLEAIVALADTMYFYQNEMDWDDRDLRIRTSMALANTLQAFGLWKESRPYALLVLDDVWQYYSQSRRLFGTLVQLRLIADGNYVFSKSRFDSREDWYGETFHIDTTGPLLTQTDSSLYKHRDRREQGRVDLRLGASFSHCAPLSLRWQWNVVGEISTPFEAIFYMSNSTMTDDSTFSRSFRLADNYMASLSSTLEFVADKRTSIRLTGTGTTERRFTNSDPYTNTPHTIQRSKNRRARADLSLLYYLSNRSIMQFSLIGLYDYSWNRTKVSNTKNEAADYGFRVSMTHYIK